MVIHRGHLDKMPVELAAPVNYWLALDEERVPLNALLGETLRLRHSGAIHCTECGRATVKSFAEGFCYPCFRKLAQCDLCILSPERCHFAAGTCREPEWALDFCMTGHIVYLANSSGVKVGITRAGQIPVRWIDQGATQALAHRPGGDPPAGGLRGGCVAPARARHHRLARHVEGRARARRPRRRARSSVRALRRRAG
jgi:hypothetical protein